MLPSLPARHHSYHVSPLLTFPALGRPGLSLSSIISVGQAFPPAIEFLELAVSLAAARGAGFSACQPGLSRSHADLICRLPEPAPVRPSGRPLLIGNAHRWSISTATARCSSVTETTSREQFFTATSRPSSPARGPASMRTICPTARYGHVCVRHLDATTVCRAAISASATDAGGCGDRGPAN